MTRKNRFVFVAGLHRSGTSLVARLLGEHPEVSAIEGSPAPENEGCYLQGAIPHTALHGIPGEFATDPQQHHVEGSAYDTLEVRERMLSDWSAWYDPQKPWWLEKSPVNLTRMRLYQQLFPMCQFVVVLRHPQASAAALQKWSETDPATLTEHALDAYDRMAEDLEYLHSAYVLRYEDLIAGPEQTRASLFRFLGLAPCPTEIALRNGNDDYMPLPDASYAVAQRMAQWGYAPSGHIGEFTPIVRHPLRQIRDDTMGSIVQN